MSAYKHIIAVSLLVVVLLATSINAQNKSHHLIVGYRMPGDKLEYTENIIKDSSFLRVVTIEKTFIAPRNELITYLEALDQKTNGNGAYASILNGGPGHNNITMKFKSQRGHGINFIVKLYARY